MADRSHLSIGEVLSLLQDDFPDVTISKIRFLESQGLLDPERTPSGYRKFYEPDIERLRWILRHQRDHFLPLKVIKDRLEAASAKGLAVPPDEPPPEPREPTPSLFEAGEGPAAEAAPPPPPGAPVEADYAPIPVPERPAARPAPTPTPAAAPAPAPTRPAPPLPPLPTPAEVLPAAGEATNPLDPGPTSGSFSLEELMAASGLDHRALGELARFGLLSGRTVGGETYYDGDAMVVVRTAAAFVQFGIEARHLRMYKVAAEREAGFMEQVVMPLLKQRNPTARKQAAENLAALAALGEQLRAALLRTALSDHTDLK
jgi:DNA-binding transcriptional MerR regulator